MVGPWNLEGVVKMCLQIGEYHLKSHMFAIDMGGCDIVLGA